MTIFNRFGFGRKSNNTQQNTVGRTRMATPGGNDAGDDRGMGGGGGRGMGGGGGRGMGGGGRGMGGGGRGMGGGGRGMGGGGQGMGQEGCRGQGGSGRGMGRRNQMTENTAAPKASQCLTQPMQEMPAPRANSTFHHIAVSSQGTSLDDAVEPRFGRASGFVLVDIETMQTQYVDNSQAQSMAQGAGIQAAENVANAGANAVLTGRVGPKAKAALDATSLYIGQNYDGMTVRQAVEKFIASIHA